MSQQFASKRDPWLMVLGFSAGAVSVLATAPILFADNLGATPKMVTAVLLVLVVVLIPWVCVSTYYVIDAGILKIRSGPFRWQIPIKEITRVTPSRAWWSSPALSLDRLCIEYGNGKWILVSPIRRDEFLEALGITGS
jgi:hypothetical protein